MIEVIHPSRLARQAFFQELLPYLEQGPGVTLRQIKKDFPHIAKLDKQLDAYIAAGYIKRENKRYELSLPFPQSIQELSLNQETFVDSQSSLAKELETLTYVTELSNETNGAILQEWTDYRRSNASLANYFFRLRQGYALTEQQEALYHILGDVNQEYALKYMTTFLLKYLRKDQLIQKRKDIFVDALVCLGYIKQNTDGKYELQLSLDKEKLIFSWQNTTID